MRKIIISLLIICLTVNSVSAAGLFDILNETFVDSAVNLPNQQGTPDINLQKVGRITGWIDIVGFKDMVRDNGVDYVPGNPANYAIVQGDAYLDIPKGQKCFTCTTDGVNKYISVTTSGNYTIATMQVTIFWHEVICDSNSCWNEYYISRGTFTDTEISPKVYSTSIGNISADIIEYNNSIYPKTVITVNSLSHDSKNSKDYITKVEYRYKDNITTYYASMGRVEETKKGISFINITKTDLWKVQGKGMGRIGDSVVIKQFPISYQDLKITASTFYQNKTVTNFNITRVDYSPEKTWHPFLFYFLGILSIFTMGSLKLYRRLT